MAFPFAVVIDGVPGVADADALYPPIQSGEFLLQRFKATRKLWGAERNKIVTDDAIEAAAE